MPAYDEEPAAAPTIKKINTKGALWLVQVFLVIICLPWSLPLMGRTWRGYKEEAAGED
jgi:hypothetical protein